uniref:1-alkyl-2-acetylglycerophosphocholine esterase n=1 Tax=Amorphochlora amoebiformis TaxID=1561963 RepID=A0A7S0DQU8_9EUKA|mmetsp:Transcript_34863/g.56245  ORF Transcript_34863/g.56245 Transcript_34863/m.56245 type:complete len:497 (+) Transcript_34863:79-1569(+)
MGLLGIIALVISILGAIVGIVFLGFFDYRFMLVALAGIYILGMSFWYYDVSRSVAQFQGSGHPYPYAGTRMLRVPGSVRYRVYYPADTTTCCGKVSPFYDGVGAFAFGYVTLGLHNCLNPDGCVSCIIEVILRILINIVPLAWISIPTTYKNADPAIPKGVDVKDSKKNRKSIDGKRDTEVESKIAISIETKGEKGFPLIVFSHGLAGTNEEHSIMFSEFARHGYVVAAIAHEDGSAPRARKEDGSNLWFVFPRQDEEEKCHDFACEFPRDPDAQLEGQFWNADRLSLFTKFRIAQVTQRQSEFHSVRNHILKDAPEEIRRIIDPSFVIAGGFSYGATTAALDSVLHPKDYVGAILWDGWFYIDGTEWPKAVHEKGIQHKSLFIGSTAFSGDHPYETAMGRLVKTAKQKSTFFALPNSSHEHFVDLPFWVPTGRPAFCLEAKGHLSNLIMAKEGTLKFLKTLTPNVPNKEEPDTQSKEVKRDPMKEVKKDSISTQN